MKRKAVSVILAVMMVAGSLDFSGFSVQAAKDNQQDYETTVGGYIEVEKDADTKKTEELIGDDPYVRLPKVSADGSLSGKSVSTQSDSLPSSYNTSPDASKVRYQGSWGTCWAHAANTNFERLVEETDQSAGAQDYSEEHMAWKLSTYGGLGYTISTKNYGGNFEMSSGYYVGAFGPMEESDYPYYGSTSHDISADDFDTSESSDIRATSIAFLPSSQTCTDGNLKYQLTDATVATTKAAVMEYGSVAASIYFDNKSTSVTPSDDYEGIQPYNSATGAYCYPWQKTVNHAIVIVGWDDNYSGDNFGADVGDGAWIIQNSWSTKFGKNGYNYVSYEDGTLSIDGTVTAYESMSDDESMYQLDGSCFGAYPFSSSFDLKGFMNVFDLTEYSELESVTFFCPFSNETCRIFMVPINEDGTPDVENRELISGDYKTPYGGYHTIELDEGITADTGKIGIMVAQDGDTASGYTSVGMEYGFSSMNRISINPGESYLVYGNDSFTKYVDQCTKTITNGTGYGNYSIKLKTKTASKPEHAHSYTKEVTKKASCTEAGEATYTCECGDSYTEEIPATGHDWNDGEVTKKASCTEAGEMTYTCTNEGCGETKTETIDATEHDWESDYTVDKEATCTEAGSKSIHCKNCSETKDAKEIPATGHNWNNGSVTKKATCTEAGEMTYNCINEGCGETKTEEIKATGHTKVKDEAVAATCTATGLTEGSHCSLCQEVLEEQKVTDALGHDWDKENGTVTKESTCTAKGNIIYKCKREGCDATLEEAISAKGHQWNEDYTIDQEASCTEVGSKSIHCANCDAVKDVIEIEAKGHSWSDWEVIESSSFAGTEKQRVCSECGKVEVEDLILRVAVKKTEQLDLSDILYGDLSYKVASTKIATVSSTGLVKGVKVGTTTLTVKSSGDDTHAANEITITIQVPTTITSATLTKTSYTYNGKSQMPGIKNINGSTKLVKDKDYQVEWPETSVKPGSYSVKITGIGNYIGSVTKTYTISKASQSISVTVPTLYVNETETLKPTSASNSFTYKSSSSKIVTVNEKGEIHGVKAGSAYITITATADSCYNSATKQVKISVVKKNQDLTADINITPTDGKRYLKVGSGAKITATGIGTITYASSNKKYATVSSNGTVTAKKKGSVKITVKAAGNSEYNAATKTILIYVVSK